VLFYLALDFQRLDCYAAFETLLANPAWWLRDDAGAVINASSIVPLADFTLPAVRAWFNGIPLGGSAANAALIDGVLADGVTGRCVSEARLSAARCQEQSEAKLLLMREMQAIFDAANGGSVLGNGIFLYPAFPDYNLPALAGMEGVMAEHFAVFESVLPSGKLDIARVAKLIELVQAAAAKGQWVVLCTWPGPLKSVAPSGVFAWPPAYAPSPATAEGWQEPLVRNHTFALAGFLTVAEETVWMQYHGPSYNGMRHGAVRCPQDPSSCSAPPGWYPALLQPLGAPLGPPVRLGNVWTRDFQFARSVLNLDDPPLSSVTFFSVSATPSGSPSGTPSGTLTPSPSSSGSATPSAAPTGSPSATGSPTPLPPPSSAPSSLGSSSSSSSAQAPPPLSTPAGAAGLAIGVLAAFALAVLLRLLLRRWALLRRLGGAAPPLRAAKGGRAPARPNSVLAQARGAETHEAHNPLHAVLPAASME
jgi:hypothetical protein